MCSHFHKSQRCFYKESRWEMAWQPVVWHSCSCFYSFSAACMSSPAGELNYIVPFMCAVLTAKLVGDMMTPSIYDAHAKLNGALAPSVAGSGPLGVALALSIRSVHTLFPSLVRCTNAIWHCHPPVDQGISIFNCLAWVCRGMWYPCVGGWEGVFVGLWPQHLYNYKILNVFSIAAIAQVTCLWKIRRTLATSAKDGVPRDLNGNPSRGTVQFVNIDFALLYSFGIQIPYGFSRRV